MDDALQEAIKKAVADEGQTSAVANRIIAWFEALSDAPEMEPERSNGFLENILEKINIESFEENWDLEDED